MGTRKVILDWIITIFVKVNWRKQKDAWGLTFCYQ